MCSRIKCICCTFKLHTHMSVLNNIYIIYKWTTVMTGSPLLSHARAHMHTDSESLVLKL